MHFPKVHVFDLVTDSKLLLSLVLTDATADGVVNYVTSVSVIQVVCMAPVTSPGNVSAMKDGVVFSATKISTIAPITSLAVMEALASTLDKDLTLVLVLQDTMEQTARINYTVAPAPSDLLVM